jgi:dTDP-4-amino-4,6-dideoxygalactose transaminase
MDSILETSLLTQKKGTSVMRDSFLVFGAPNLDHREYEAVAEVMRSGWLGTGPKVAQFESEFAAYKGAAHAAAVNSCTAALHLSILAARIGPGDEVITTPMTFCATINVIVHAGATPVLADIDPVTLNIDPKRVREKITSRTKAIIVVHFAGRAAEMDELLAIAKEFGLKIIEDCAHAVETEYNSRPTGLFGDFGCFSFYITKNIVTGEGGIVLARDERDHQRIKTLSLHGMNRDAWKRFSADGFRHYQVTEAGFKYNMLDLQAAIGIEQLRKIERFWIRRQEIWLEYQAAFQNLPIALPADPAPSTRHAYHLYTIMLDQSRAGISRDDFLGAMTDRRIGVGVHYLSVPEHPYYQHTFGWDPEQYPHAMRVGRHTVSLPLTSKMTTEDVGCVIASVHDVLSKGCR